MSRSRLAERSWLTSRRARCCRTALAVLLCLGVGLATVASAGPLEEAKAAGWLGERPDGYIGVVSQQAPASAHDLAADVNSRRSESYQEIALRNGTTPVAVAILAGRKLIERTPPGQYVMDDQGRWVKKPR